jgi:type II secretory pathway pseudopilin PulG
MMRQGFTFIETIVTIFIFTLAMGAVSGIIMMLYRTHDYTWQQSQAIEEGRRGIETMVKEIREARTSEDGSYIIASTTDFQFSFYSDIDRDLVIEKVRYFVEGTNFKKGVIKPVGIPAVYSASGEEISILSQYVRNTPPIFRYFDENGQELPPPARRKDTKLMQVYLVINVDENRPPQDFELKSEVQIRNLKTNL